MPYHAIESLTIEGGFLDGAHLKFDKHLNCIIGGRGTGKSTILEFTRYLMDLLPSGRRANDRWSKVEGLVHANLSGGRLSARIKSREGTRYEVARSDGDSSVVSGNDGRSTGISIGSGIVFGADIYSQDEIEEIADNPLFQLELIDKFVRKDLQDVQAKLKGIIERLRSNATALLKTRHDGTRLAEQIKDLPDIAERLKAFAPQGTDKHSQAVRTEQGRRSQRLQELNLVEQVNATYAKAIEDIGLLSEEFRSRLDEHFDWEWKDAPNAALLRVAQGHAKKAVEAVRRSYGVARDEVGKAQKQLNQVKEKLLSAHQPQEQAYQKLMSDAEALRGRERERMQLEKRHAELQAFEKELEQLRKKYKTLQTERNKLRESLSEFQDDRYELRRRTAEFLNEKLSPMIRVRVEQYGNTESYRSLLLSALKGSGLRYVSLVEKIVDTIPPSEFAALVQKEDRERLEQVLEVDPDRAMRVILQLKDSDAIYAIETVELHDRPFIELKDGSAYKDSGSLSTGQKCTTILPILLLESENPLLIDQPEDNLDNAFVYDTVVRSILNVKGKRQLIFVTHNPNIPVLGEAGRVFVLDSDGKKASIAKAGTVDETKSEIESVLEGGEEAFRMRMKRYGY